MVVEAAVSRHLPWRPTLKTLLAPMLLCLLLCSGCGDRVTEPRICWTGIDTLYASGIAIADTADVHRAFDAYIAFVDTTDAEFPDGETWRYLSSAPSHTWKGRFYWAVRHDAYSPGVGRWIERLLVYVDANGCVVWPYGCI